MVRFNRSGGARRFGFIVCYPLPPHEVLDDRILVLSSGLDRSTVWGRLTNPALHREESRRAVPYNADRVFWRSQKRLETKKASLHEAVVEVVAVVVVAVVVPLAGFRQLDFRISSTSLARNRSSVDVNLRRGG